MKNERRHDLETNELAVRLTGWIDWIKPHASTITGAVLVLLGVMAASSYWSTQSASNQQAAWNEFAIAYDTTDRELVSLRKVADKEEYSGTPMREWAYITWADRQLRLASEEYLINRESAIDRLRQVEGTYEDLSAGVFDVVVQNRARYGLARVYELQNKPEEARKQYLLVQGDLQSMASRRATQLESSTVEESVAWLATTDLPRRSTNLGDGASGVRPDFEAATPRATQGGDVSVTRSLEEILGSVGEDATGEDRYEGEPEDESETEATETETEPTSDTSKEATAEDVDVADADVAE